MDDIRRVALELRKAICCKESEMSWSPERSQLTEEEIDLPNEVTVFLATLLTGNSKYPEEPCSSKVQRLVKLVWTRHGILSDWRPKEASKTHITTLRCQNFDK